MAYDLGCFQGMESSPILVFLVLQRMASSLKRQNRLKLYLAVAANFGLYTFLAHATAVESGSDFPALIAPQGLISQGFGILLTSLLAAQLSPTAKARLVFLRWRHPLPGSFAFTMHARTDERIDLSALRRLHSPLPQLPAEQNALWYRLYRSVAQDPAVEQVHSEYLLTRDLTAIFTLLFPVFIGVGFYTIEPPLRFLLFTLVIFIQFVLSRRAAAAHGRRLVTTVLAIVASEPK